MLTLNAKIRKKQGKSASRRLRTVNKCPAIIYGGKTAPIPIELDHEKVWNIQKKTSFYNEVLTVHLIDSKKEEKVKVKAIQRHAYKLQLTHIDFIRSDS